MERKGGEGGRIGPGEKPGCNADSVKAHSAPQGEFCSRKGHSRVPSQVSGKVCAFVPLHRAVIPKEG